jgi:hypothetical protein
MVNYIPRHAAVQASQVPAFVSEMRMRPDKKVGLLSLGMLVDYWKFFHLPLVTETEWQLHEFHPQCQQAPTDSEKPVNKVGWFNNFSLQI